MAISPLPLSYCTNVHPGTSLAQVEHGLIQYTARVRQAFGRPLAAGLWLAAPVVRELLAEPERLSRFRELLAECGLSCHTLNAFPYGDFHSTRVKENVYLPDWAGDERRDYTLACARVLAHLLPEQGTGSISTLPLGFKLFPAPESFLGDCVRRLLGTARGLDALRRETGRTIGLAIEPEPLCRLETTDEAVAFFAQLYAAAAGEGLEAIARRHLGLCYDVCHQAVEFEDIGSSLSRLQAAGIPIFKLHLSCALHVDDPRDSVSRAALARYAEPRYLHQTFARTARGDVLRQVDLTEDLATHPPEEYLEAEAWRVHFHVPVDADRLGPLRTTRAELIRALAAVAEFPDAPQLEVETYTWEVLPGAQDRDLVAGLTRELTATAQLLEAFS